jgi:hypothetical protein
MECNNRSTGQIAVAFWAVTPTHVSSFFRKIDSIQEDPHLRAYRSEYIRKNKISKGTLPTWKSKILEGRHRQLPKTNGKIVIPPTIEQRRARNEEDEEQGRQSTKIVCATR